ncbi:MAG: DUF1499 domain-containing protein [Pseudomonadota bacterium]|nr:DUF1499 domain-containing protein [Pseudomonadota bacterium]
MVSVLKLVAILIFGLLVMLWAAGQLGLLRGGAPTTLGVRDGRLAPPSNTPNSVSSQAGFYPEHPQRAYADIAPLAYSGDAQAAMRRLGTVLETTPDCVLVTREPGYLYAQCSTPRLKFTDDLEFALDAAAGVIHLRSASRLGRKDFGVNRARMEALRVRFSQDNGM